LGEIVKPSSLNAYEDVLEQWLRVAGLDASVRFIGSLFRVDIWSPREYVWIPTRDVVRKMDEILNEGFVYQPRHISTFAELAGDST